MAERPERQPVKFIARWGGYNVGEVAGFIKSRREQLIKDKYAKPFSERGTIGKAADAVKKAVGGGSAKAEKTETGTQQPRRSRRRGARAGAAG